MNNNPKQKEIIETNCCNLKCKIILKNSINSIIELLKSEDNEFIRLGLYMALSNIKNRIAIEDEKLLNDFNLNKDLEKYL